MDKREPIPVINYATPSTPARRAFAKSPPQEVWACWLIVGSVCIGSVANDVSRGAGVLLMPGVTAGVVWYVVVRLRRRKRTRLLWKAQLLLATLVCAFGTMGVVFATDGEPHLWRNYRAADRWATAVMVGIAWFAAAELAVVVDRWLWPSAPLEACPPLPRAE